MFCSACGNSVPDGSRYCLHCGTRISAESGESAKTGPSTAPPKYIKDLGGALNGVRDGDKRGFRLWFQLVDAAGNATAVDGTLKIKVGPDMMWSKYSATIQVKRQDFDYSTKDPSWFGYKFDSVKPTIASWDRYVAEIEFETATGIRLKAKQVFW